MAYLALHTAQHGNNSLLGAGNKLSTAPTALLTPAIKVCSTRTAYTHRESTTTWKGNNNCCN